jgi:DNA-binding transcriptional MocR family regulator
VKTQIKADPDMSELPSAADLMRNYKISRGVALRAFGILQKDGFAEPVPGASKSCTGSTTPRHSSLAAVRTCSCCALCSRRYGMNGGGMRITPALHRGVDQRPHQVGTVTMSNDDKNPARDIITDYAQAHCRYFRTADGTGWMTTYLTDIASLKLKPRRSGACR